ncbi:hypothetical protein B6N60_04889 [Richelia sinica FACHB-800]|uniref:Uncharacterized protein n=1 Tax=Richelia sinica FACHB-800 TaxID=1357546 RepID=A0A975Y7B5_9NOST|nr:TrbI/VirB10 family protein [Richelia sinica]MBD2666213.1 hypothetical protein [Richelia sinica FACHB-800]QXE26158.1 hypothetical protein B6N60_04889 [Richelia sinica FACHB-800]
MEDSNQNHEFNSLNGNSVHYSLESNTTNNNHGSSSTVVVADEDISPEEEQWLAGYNPAASQLISEEYRLKQDAEKALERPLAEKPGVRLVSVVTLVGTVIASGSLLWFGFLQPQPPAKQAAKATNPSPTSEPPLDESAELKSRLAFQDQQQQLKAEPVPTPSPQATLPAKPQRTPTRTVGQTVTPRVAEPAHIVRRYSSPIPIHSPVMTTPSTIQKTANRPETIADALQQWNQLASLGQSQISNSAPMSIQEQPTLDNKTLGHKNLKTPKLSTPIPQETELQTVLIGSKSIENQTDSLSPGMIGILNRTPVGLVNSQTETVKDIALGESTAAKVIMPMIWDEGGQNPNDRFAVELTTPLKATDGTVALPAGTVVVAQTAAVGKKNNLVSATGIALIYPNSQGKVKQKTIPANTLLIRGGNKQPLIAQKLHDAGSDIAKQDLLVGLLSSLGKVGSIVNQPRTQSSTVVSGGSFNQSTVTTNSDPQIWAAALEGFFTPVSDRLSRRSDQAVQELLQRPNIQYLPEGMEVSVVVNNFLKFEQ